MSAFEGGGLFGKRANNGPAWTFNQQNLNAEEEIALIGQPKLMRTIKQNEFPGGNQCIEVQFKMSMILPTKIYATKRDLEKFFEESVGLEMANIHYEIIELEAVGRTSGFIVDEEISRKCDGDCKGCPKCLGEKEMKKLKEFMEKNAELVHPHTFTKFQCLENEKVLEDLGDLMLAILRGALLGTVIEKTSTYMSDRGRMKFGRDDWQFIIACLWEQRALEIVRGTKWALMHELCRSTWNGYHPFAGDQGEHFSTKVRRMIRIIIETAPDKEIAQVLREEMSYYDPRGNNDRRFMEGRCEWMDLEGTNTMIVSVGGYHSIRRGKIRKGYKGDKQLQSRSSRISKAHMVAALGNMVVPAGVVQDETDTVLPIPLKKNGKTETKDKRKYEPVTILYRK